MNALAQYQRALARALRERDPASLSGVISGDPARSQIYVNNHVIGLVACLADIYPVVRAVIGDHCFQASARDFVAATPMRTGNVLDYGHNFPSFIRDCEHLRALPYLADLAMLEWTRHEVIHARDPSPERTLPLSAIATLDDAALRQLQLALIPSARLFVSDYPCLRIWQMHQPNTGIESVSLDEGGVKCLMLRSGLNVGFVLLTDAELVFLQQLSARPLLAAAEHALQCGLAFDLAAALARFSPCLQGADAWRNP